jgi:FemAB-related protein (PEP-CTERM system-associated)
MPVNVFDFSPEIRPQWDQFVLGHPHGSPFHLTAWKDSIERTFRFQPLYLYASEGARIQGVLPLFLVSNMLMGKVLVSSPFAVYGGILADSDDARGLLYERARALGSQLQVEHIEFRNAFPEQCVGSSNVSRYVTFSQSVGPDEDALLAALPKKTRNMVRKSLKHPFQTRRQCSNSSAFEALYSKNMRRLGTPSFPNRHFENLRASFGNAVDISEVVLDDKVVAVSMNFYFRDQMHTYYAASDPAYKDLAPNTYMYFDHLRWAGQNGYRVFDFGRCKRDTGVFEFKRHWATEMRELPYEVVLVKGEGQTKRW